MDEMVVPFYREDLDVGRQLSSTIRCENSTVTEYSHFTRSIRDLKVAYPIIESCRGVLIFFLNFRLMRVGVTWHCQYSLMIWKGSIPAGRI